MKKPKPKPLTLRERKALVKQIKQSEAEYAEEQKRHEDYVRNLPSPTPESFTATFRMYAEKIKEHLRRLDYNGKHPEIKRLYDVYRESIKQWTAQAKQRLENCPDFGELPPLAAANADREVAMTMLAEHCEHVAHLLEQPEKKTPTTTRTQGGKAASGQQRETPEKNESAVLREIADKLTIWREAGPGENEDLRGWVNLREGGREAAVGALRLLRDNADRLRRCASTYRVENSGCNQALSCLDDLCINHNPPEHIENYWGWGRKLALPGFIEELKRWAGELDKPKPKPRRKLGKTTSLIYEKLLTLPEHRAMKLPEIVQYLWDKHEINLSDTEVYKHVKKLEPWGLQHDKRIGYSITAEQKSIGQV